MGFLNVAMTRLMVCHMCRGILFHGAPGSGKTLVARALAGACRHSSSTPVTLFARKGPDCLGKFAGEAERTLRLLFDEVCTQLASRTHNTAAVAGYTKHRSHTPAVMHALATCADLPLKAYAWYWVLRPRLFATTHQAVMQNVGSICLSVLTCPVQHQSF